jgi:deoxyadenosine/deoxycytidine kinase
MRIELVGGLGVGKSTLCHALEDVGFNCIYENLNTNPFLADCFKDPQKFRFPSQMWFVLSKYHEIQKHEIPGRVNVLDQSVLNVCAYTNMLFGESDPYAMHIINQCFHYMEQQTGMPDLLINLQCSPQEQMRRIRGRNRDHERGVTLDYITNLQTEINILVNHARTNGYRILNIDTESVFMPGNVAYARQLARQIAEMFNIDMGEYTPAPQQALEVPPVVAYAESLGEEKMAAE